jgi:carboxylate-amine ligase
LGRHEAHVRRDDETTEATTDTLTFGVEEEYLIVDRETGALAARSDALVDAAAAIVGDAAGPELNSCQIEVASGVCHDLRELRDDLTRLRRLLSTAAADLGSAIAATGTHPFSSWEDQRVNAAVPRYRRIEERYQVMARQQVICGCHVHVGIEDDDLRIEVMNRARPWLPVLLALSANSPYWHGVDTGFASYRTEVWERWPTAGFPPHVSTKGEYDEAVRRLVAIDAIEEETQVYWYLRPSARYPTVEFRACDVCLDVEDAVAIAALIRALAWTCARDAINGVDPIDPPLEAMSAAMWRAARYGLDGSLVDARCTRTQVAASSVCDLLTYVQHGLDAHGDSERVQTRVAWILEWGNGARAQRSACDPSATVDLIVRRTQPA